jgi:hypothetical protein
VEGFFHPDTYAPGYGPSDASRIQPGFYGLTPAGLGLNLFVRVYCRIRDFTLRRGRGIEDCSPRKRSMDPSLADWNKKQSRKML